MKTLRLLLILLLFPLLSRAASPSYNSFLPSWFTNNNIVIGLNTNLVLTWQMVSTNYLTTNGNSLSLNTNAVLALVSGTSNNIVVPPPSTGVLFNSNGVLRANPNFVFNWANTNVGIGISNPQYRFVVNGDGSAFPQILLTNANGAWVGMILSGNTAAFQLMSVGSAGAYQTVDGFVESTFSFNTRSNASGRRYMRFNNRDNRLFAESLSDAGGPQNKSLIISNNAAEASLVIHSNGVVEFGAASPGGAITFQSDRTMRQATVATNAVRIFGLGGITASPSNNTANGSIDYRLSSVGDTNFPHTVITNGTLYGNTLWTASSDTTNFILNPALNERTINMAANVRVISASALNPAGFRGFVGVTITNNSGSSYNFDTTNTFVPYGTNTLTIPTGKAARVVFQIDENRVFWGGAVQP